MKLTEEELKELYQQGTARSARRRADCLTEEMLLQAATGELSAADDERVTEHLMVCSDCIQEYRFVRTFKPWEDQVETAYGAPVRERPGRWWVSLQAFRQHLIWTPQGRATVAAAASALVVTLAFSAWIISVRRQLPERDRAIAVGIGSLEQARRQLEEATRRAEHAETRLTELRTTHDQQVAGLQQAVDELAQPQLNVPIADLNPRPVQHRGERPLADKIITMPPQANVFTLILNTDDLPSYPRYLLEILNQRSQSVWRGEGLQPSSYGTFTVVLSRRLFPAGSYQIKLYGLRERRTHLVGEYAVRIK